ncbi:MAG: hypothetical protein AB1810_08255 [Pseudomonadota bacterium]
MTSFNIPPDDTGIRNLRSANAQPATTAQVDSVPAYPRAASVRPGVPTPVERAVQQALAAERHPGRDAPLADTVNGALASVSNRRQRIERRVRQVPVLLDTRSGRERRQVTSPGNSAEEQASENPPRLGIDIYT